VRCANAQPDQVAGTVRITTTDTILHGLVAPALKALRRDHPLLGYELHTGNELANLTRRDADIAVRATKRPPQHLVGRHLGPIRVALYAARKSRIRRFDDVERAARLDRTLRRAPEHPSVVWRRSTFRRSFRRIGSRASSRSWSWSRSTSASASCRYHRAGAATSSH
jgi:DNA-binding transcriptional LysR family regulator